MRIKDIFDIKDKANITFNLINDIDNLLQKPDLMYEHKGKQFL